MAMRSSSMHRWLAAFESKLIGTNQRGKKKTHGGRTQMQLESLEARCMLSTVTASDTHEAVPAISASAPAVVAAARTSITDTGAGQNYVVAAAPVVGAPHPAIVVNIPDSHLLAAIRIQLGIPQAPITDYDMQNLTTLTAYTGDGIPFPNNHPIVDLTGLEWASNLGTLDLHSNQITDISVLSAMPNAAWWPVKNAQLTTLDISYNQITDITPLWGALQGNRFLTLTDVNVSNNKLTSLAPLQQIVVNGAIIKHGVPLLQVLDASNNQITTVSPLQFSPPASDPTASSPLVSLKLSYNLLNDNIYDNMNLYLGKLTKLTTLYLDHNQISHIGVLTNFTSMKDLKLNDNFISDNLISDIGIISTYMPNIVACDVSNNYLYISSSPDSTPLTKIKAIQALGATVIYTPQKSTSEVIFPDTHLHDALAGLFNKPLTTTVYWDKITTGDMYALRDAELANNNIVDITNLDTASNMQILNLGDTTTPSYPSKLNQVVDLTPLANLTSLGILSLSYNKITDLTPLASLPLNTLYLDHNELVDISPLSSLTGLGRLWLQFNNIIDITALTHFGSLQDVELEYNYLDVDNPSSAAMTVINTLVGVATARGSGNVTYKNQHHFAPTDIALSPATVPENQPAATTVGTFTSTDPGNSTSTSYVYTLVAGVGSTDNLLFTIANGGVLKTAATFNFEAISSYSIRVRSTNQEGLYYEKTFTVSVTNVNEAPSVTSISKNVTQNQTLGFTSTDFSTSPIFTDPDSNDALSNVMITALPTHGTLTLGSVAVTLNQVIPVAYLGALVYTPATDYSGSDSFGWNGSDVGGLYALTGALVNISVTFVPTSITPGTPDLVAGPTGDTGASTSDNLTNLDNSTINKKLSFTVSNTVQNATIRLYADGNNLIGTAIANGTSTLVTTTGLFDLIDGYHTITATQAETGGKPLSLVSAALTIKVDTVAPVAPLTPALDYASDTGFSHTDGITTDTTPSFNGSTVPYNNIELLDSGVSLGTTIVHAGGTWDFTSGVLAPGTHSITARAFDAAGNYSAQSAPLSISILASTPTTVTMELASGQSSSVTTLPIHFTAIFSAPVTGFTSTDVLLGGTAPGTKSVVITSSSGSGTTFDVTVSGLTGSGTLTASLPAGVAYDYVGNLTQASTSVSNTVTYTLPLVVAPPTNVTASSDLTDKVHITWAGSVNATAYEVWRINISDSNSLTKISTTDVTGHSFDDTTAVPGVTYYYRVKAKNTDNTSAFSGGATGGIHLVLPGISIADAVPVLEGTPTPGNTARNQADFVVTLSAASSTSVTVKYAAQTGTAAPSPALKNARVGVDFVTTTGTLTFAPGETSKHIYVSIIGNSIVETDKTFKVVLSNASGGISITQATASATIVNDDMPLVTITATGTASENTPGSPYKAYFTVTRSTILYTPLVVNLATTGTAIAGNNYVALSTTVTIPAGKASATVPLYTIDDLIAEGSTFVQLTAVADPTYTTDVKRSTAKLTIIDNEPIVSIKKIRNAYETPSTTAANGRFMVSLDHATTADVVVHYNVSGTATPGTDYQSLTGTVTILAGKLSAYIDVTSIDDTIVDPNETIILTLVQDSTPSYLLSTLTASRLASIVIIDNDKA